MGQKKAMKKVKKIFLYSIAFILALLWICNYTIDKAAEGKTFFNTTDIPKNRVGLVLGTSNKLSNGQPNPYYQHRIKATIALYKASKVDYILVSGDNSSKYYNEPKTFKKDLIAGGIPEEKIYLDYAGFRTLDSVMRAHSVFGLNSVTVISQEFHNERAIYIAQQKGLNAVGFNAKGVEGSSKAKMYVRESFARVKVFIDLIINKQPKFYGDRIEIK